MMVQKMGYDKIKVYKWYKIYFDWAGYIHTSYDDCKQWTSNKGNFGHFSLLHDYITSVITCGFILIQIVQSQKWFQFPKKIFSGVFSNAIFIQFQALIL